MGVHKDPDRITKTEKGRVVQESAAEYLAWVTPRTVVRTGPENPKV